MRTRDAALRQRCCLPHWWVVPWSSTILSWNLVRRKITISLNQSIGRWCFETSPLIWCVNLCPSFHWGCVSTLCWRTCSSNEFIFIELEGFYRSICSFFHWIVLLASRAHWCCQRFLLLRASLLLESFLLLFIFRVFNINLFLYLWHQRRRLSGSHFFLILNWAILWTIINWKIHFSINKSNYLSRHLESEVRIELRFIVVVLPVHTKFVFDFSVIFICGGIVVVTSLTGCFLSFGLLLLFFLFG